MIGKVFTRLTVISQSASTARGSKRWTCLCECGKTKVVTTSSLNAGSTKSCGCLNAENIRKAAKTMGNKNKTHGQSKSSEYYSWEKARKRCLDPESEDWPNYGGRGITMCQGWIESFETFLKDMGPRPEGTSLERENNSLGYNKGNCKWATRKEQNRNKRSNINLTYGGVTKCLKDWATEFDISYVTLWHRIKVQNLTLEEAIKKGKS